MLIELGTDRLSNLKRRTFKSVQGTVAGLLGLVSAQGISPNIISAEPLSQSTGISRTINPDVGINIDSTTKAVMESLAQLSVDLSQVVPDLTEPLGGTLTKAWIGEDGLLRIADKKLILKQGLDGKFKPSHLLQQLYDSGNGDLLRFGILGGDPLPSPGEFSADPTPKVLNTLYSLADYFQVGYFISQSANFGGFNVYNVSDEQGITFALLEITDGPNSGKLTLANITPQIINSGLGLISQDLVLSEEQIGTGGGTPEPIPQPTPVPSGTGQAPVPTPKPEPQPTPTIIVFPRYPQIPLPTPPPAGGPAITQRPQVRGDQECIRQTNTALDLLKDKLPVEYNFVLVHIGVAECVEGGGASVFGLETPPRAIFPRSLREEAIVYAGALTHESCHIWDFRRFREMYPAILPIPPGYISGAAAEEGCHNIEYQTLKKLGDSPENLQLFRDFLKQRFGYNIFSP